VAALADGGCASVLAVVRYGVDVPGAHLLVNDDPERGIRSSLALAVDAADGDALAVLLVDLPGVSADAIRAVVAAWPARPGHGRDLSRSARSPDRDVWRAVACRVGDGRTR